jgi:hypothetical protein
MIRIQSIAFFSLFILLILASCDNVDQEPTPVLDADHLYFDYNISATEEKENVALRLEFKHNSRSRGLLLEDSAKVELDGENIAADSSKYYGVFYETSKPRASFTGQHLIEFTGVDGKVVRQPFWFLPLSLREELPPQISRKPFKIKVNNPDTSLKQVQLVMVDTSFNSKDVNDDVPVSNGEITISGNMLNRLVNGPIILEIHSEKILPLAQKTRKGGRVAIYYSLNREFELTEGP